MLDRGRAIKALPLLSELARKQYAQYCVRMDNRNMTGSPVYVRMWNARYALMMGTSQLYLELKSTALVSRE